MSEDNQIKTLGEQRVRTSFNPSQTDIVAQIKQKSAELINLCEELKVSKIASGEVSLEKELNNGEFIRLASLAQTSYEEAAMWAVKAATT
jgi:hypothetical protein